MIGKRAGLGKMLERRENFKDVDLRFLETGKEDQKVREQRRMEATNH